MQIIGRLDNCMFIRNNISRYKYTISVPAYIYIYVIIYLPTILFIILFRYLSIKYPKRHINKIVFNEKIINCSIIMLIVKLRVSFRVVDHFMIIFDKTQIVGLKLKGSIAIYF